MESPDYKLKIHDEIPLYNDENSGLTDRLSLLNVVPSKAFKHQSTKNLILRILA